MRPDFFAKRSIARWMRVMEVSGALLMAVRPVVGVRAGELVPVEVKVSRQMLGKRPILMDPKSAHGSADGRHFAFVVRRGRNMTVWFEGTEGPAYSRVNPLLFAPAGGRFGYIATKADEADVLVVDGTEVAIHTSISPRSLTFSPDASRFAYVVAHPTNEAVTVPPFYGTVDGARVQLGGYTPLSVVLDGKSGRGYPGIDTQGLVFSPDSKHLAYTASLVAPSHSTNGLDCLVLDGVETKPYESVYGTNAFSPDSRRLALAVQVAGQRHVMVCNCPMTNPADGKRGRAYDLVVDGSLSFTPDSQNVIYRAERNGKRLLVVGEEEVVPAEASDFGDPVFSQDGKHRADFISGHTSFWLIDNKRGREYEGVGALLFSPDSQRVAYVGKRNHSWFLVLDGQESRAFDEIGDAFRFTPDSKPLLALARRDRKYRLVRNLEEQAGELEFRSTAPLLYAAGEV
jgi:hypothetical protein